MPYPPILRDINGDPIPQVWDKEAGNWRPVTGDDYGQRVRILGADGHLIDTDNPLEVRVRELEGELQQVRQLLEEGDAKVQLSGQTMAPGDTIPVQQSAIVLDRLEQIERALLISAGLRHEYYIDGMEHARGGWVEGITSGPEDWWERYKAEDHMYFFTQRNPDGTTDVSYVTKEKVDLTDVRFVYVEFEAEVLNFNHGATSPNLYLIASIDSEGAYSDYEARSTIYGSWDGSSEGRIIRGLNVTGLTGEYYLRLHIMTNAMTSSFDLATKIFRVWGE